MKMILRQAVSHSLDSVSMWKYAGSKILFQSISFSGHNVSYTRSLCWCFCSHLHRAYSPCSESGNISDFNSASGIAVNVRRI